MYSAWMKINETLPWIELEGTFRTRSDARRFVKHAIKGIETKVVNIPEKKKRQKATVNVKATR